MIGLLLRAAGLGDVGTAGVGGCVACLVACCLAAGLYKCSQCRMRDCPCIKWYLRTTGADSFEDFELFVVVHECQFIATDSDLATVVKVSAGKHSVDTDAHKRVFQQPMSIFIEQGTEKLEVEMMDSWGRHRLAKVDLDIADILEAEGGFREHVFSMKACKRGLANPRIKLTIHKTGGDDEEVGVLSKIQVTEDHTGMMVMDHLHKVQQAELAAKESEDVAEGKADMKSCISQGALLASACSGYLELLGSWGKKDKVWVAVNSGPTVKKAFLGVWADRRGHESDSKPERQIDLLRIKSVQAHPSQDSSFMINEVLRSGSVQQYTFYRIDRSRDVWVQTLSLLISEEREKREKKKKGKASGRQ